MSLKNGAAAWTGGTYSFYRAVFGLYLLVHFLQLIPYGRELFSREGVLPSTASPLARIFPNVLGFFDAPAVVTLVLVAGALAAVLFAIGLADRAAAIVCWYVWACLFGRDPLIQNPSLPYVGWLLLAHTVLPRAPYGSMAARGRTDPGGGWRMPYPIFLAGWVVMAAGYSYSGLTKLGSPSWIDGTAVAHVLGNPLARPGPLRTLILSAPAPALGVASWCALAFEVLFAPLALSARLRPVIWSAMLGMHLSLIALIDFADLSFGMMVLHFFTFDPSWVRSAAGSVTRVFYDGTCGLCHRAVRFLLAEDRHESFRFAALHVLARLGGLWRVVAAIARLVPARLLDALYDGVARIRARVFARPGETCPLMPKELRARFDP